MSPLFTSPPVNHALTIGVTSTSMFSRPVSNASDAVVVVRKSPPAVVHQMVDVALSQLQTPRSLNPLTSKPRPSSQLRDIGTTSSVKLDGSVSAVVAPRILSQKRAPVVGATPDAVSAANWSTSK